MATYKGKAALVDKPAEEIYARFNDFSKLKEVYDMLPEEQKGKMGELKFDTDALAVVTPQIGELRFAVKERVEPSKVTLVGEGTPVPLSLTININGQEDGRSEVYTTIDVEIPMMLKPFIGPKIQEVADKFSESMLNLGK